MLNMLYALAGALSRPHRWGCQSQPCMVYMLRQLSSNIRPSLRT